ncbi:hypothetical protein D3C84_1239240 [compost metagenome]
MVTSPISTILKASGGYNDYAQCKVVFYLRDSIAGGDLPISHDYTYTLFTTVNSSSTTSDSYSH